MLPTGTARLRVLESACDYVTATVRPGNSMQILMSRAEHWFKLRSEEGYLARPWAWQGYRGRIIDGITYGSRETDTLVRLSGTMAKRWAHTLVTWADNISRLDVQVTLQDDGLVNNWAELAHRCAQNDRRVSTGQLHTQITYDTPEGCSSYIGSGDSDRLLRCYDKHAESEGEYPPGTWRYEVEWKGRRAWRAAESLAGTRFLPWICAEAVQIAYQDYGVTVPMAAISSGWRDAAIPHTSTDERRLAWLSRCIKPMLEGLSQNYAREQLLTTLGMDEYDHLTGERLERMVKKMRTYLADPHLPNSDTVELDACNEPTSIALNGTGDL